MSDDASGVPADDTCITLTVIDPSGLHARPAARFVQAASRFTSRITIRHAGREADAKSLVALLGLTIGPSSQIVLAAEGPDAADAIVVLSSTLAPYVTEARAAD